MRNPERFTPVEWDGGASQSFRVQIAVVSWDRPRLLEDVARTFAEHGDEHRRVRRPRRGPDGEELVRRRGRGHQGAARAPRLAPQPRVASSTPTASRRPDGRPSGSRSSASSSARTRRSPRRLAELDELYAAVRGGAGRARSSSSSLLAAAPRRARAAAERGSKSRSAPCEAAADAAERADAGARGRGGRRRRRAHRGCAPLRRPGARRTSAWPSGAARSALSRAAELEAAAEAAEEGADRSPHEPPSLPRRSGRRRASPGGRGPGRARARPRSRSGGRRARAALLVARSQVTAERDARRAPGERARRGRPRRAARRP